MIPTTGNRSGASCACILAVAVACAPAGPARAQRPGIEMTFEVCADQTGAVGPYRAGDLTLTNHGKEVLREVRLRWTEGGPTIVCPVVLAPGAQQKVRVFLPAAAPLQTYRATFRGDGPFPPAEATISWSIEHAAREAWVSSSAYEPYDMSQPTWSGQVRMNVMLGTAIAALAAAGTLFLRRRVVRMCALLAVAAIASAGGALALAGTDLVVDDVFALNPAQPARQTVRTCALLAVAATASAGGALAPAGTDLVVDDVFALDAPPPGGPRRNLHVVAVRRTTRWSPPDVRLVPVYKDESQMYNEAMILHPHHGASVVISPGQLRLFRTTGPAR